MAMPTGFQVENLKEATARSWEQLVGTDDCPRCGGLLVTDQWLDLQDDSGQLDFWGRRCVQCGEVIDPVILQNRRREPSEHATRRTSGAFPWSGERR